MLERNENLSLEEAIELYRQALEEKGTVAISYKETKRRLRLFFPDLQMAVTRVTAERAREYYDAFRKAPRPDGKPRSVAYHRCTLINARSFFTWCKEAGLVHVNPVADVKGIGKRKRGKKQHTGDETARLFGYCYDRALRGDEPALAILMLVTMALRSADVTRRLVRDVDMGGTVLRVENGKTDESNRPRKIPNMLQSIIQQLVLGRPPLEPLFKTPLSKSGHHTRSWLVHWMDVYCRAAGVPYVCPHSLKGAAANTGAETGALADQIADHLSHRHASTTQRHYLSSGVLDEAKTARGLAGILSRLN